MTNIKHYLQDGACAQARATLMLLQSEYQFPEGSTIYVARWENCKEQGYIIRMQGQNHKGQINVAFFEHRNSDSLCAVKWVQSSMNSITIDTANFNDIYKDKWDLSKSVSYGQFVEMAEWISEEFDTFWQESKNKAVKDAPPTP